VKEIPYPCLGTGISLFVRKDKPKAGAQSRNDNSFTLDCEVGMDIRAFLAGKFKFHSHLLHFARASKADFLAREVYSMFLHAVTQT
jgi:hypothetical protein